MKHTPEQRKQNAIINSVAELQSENNALRATVAQLEAELWAVSEPSLSKIDNQPIVGLDHETEKALAFEGISEGINEGVNLNIEGVSEDVTAPVVPVSKAPKNKK